MTRSIVGGSLVRPAWRVGEVAVEGPDEDAFTLAVEAIEALPFTKPIPIGRVHLVGEYPAGIAEMLPEATDSAIGEVRRHPPSADAIWGALAAAQDAPPGSPADLVVAVDLAGPRRKGVPLEWGTAAAAIRVAEGSGALLLPPDSSEGTPGAGGDPAEFPHTTPVKVGEAVSAEASATILAVEAVRAIADCTRGAPTAPYVVLTGRGTGIGARARLRTEGAVRWTEVNPAPGRALSPEEFTSRSVDVPASISEGAYLPRPTYLETRPSRWRLIATECSACGALSFPARGVCRACGQSEQIHPLALDRASLPVEATTVVHPGAQPTEFDGLVRDLGAYEVVVVRAAPTVRLTLQLTDGAAGSIAIGDRVGTQLRRLYPMEGEWRYGRKAVPTARVPSHPQTL